MTVTEYVGARYVPIFGRMGETSVEWDNSAPYEPLTIVLYQGNSYTSRQYVPAGIAIDNTQYWALTGNFNAQIEQYRAEVQGFAGDIQANADAIETNTDDIATIKANGWVTANRIAAGAVTGAKIANGAVTPEKATNGSLIVFGDSWATAPNTWIATYAGKMKYSSYKTYAVIGAAFLNRSDNLISAQIATAQSDSSVNKNDVTEVIVIGGVNDYRTDSTNPTDVAAAVISTLDGIAQLYPNAHIRYFLDCEITGYPFSWYENFCTIYNKGYDCSNLINAMAFNNYAYNSDNLHPNGTGENLIASYLQVPSLMSFGTSIVAANMFTSSDNNSSVESCTCRKCKDVLITRLEIRHTANAENQITFSLPQPLNNIVFDRTHSVVSEFTSSNPGKYAIGYNGGLVAASNTVTATDYVTIMTKLPY